MQYKLTQAPSKSMPLIQSSWTSPTTGLLRLIGSNFNLSTLLLVGACLQAIVLAALNSYRLAFLPAFLLLGVRIVDALLIHWGIRPNPYMQGVYMGRNTALVPDMDGQINDERNKIVILLLGVKSNHPFGVFAPQFLKIGDWLEKMNVQFNGQNGESRPKGFLGQTGWERKDEKGAREFTFISYWRSIEDVHAFAHSPLHREAWQWWEKTLKQNDYLGINHEVFEADAKHWETVYANFQPTGLGATTYLRKGEKLEGGTVGDEWIMPLVDARRGKLAKSSARLGRDPTKYDEVHPDTDAYAREC